MGNSTTMTATIEAASNRRQPVRATRINSTRTLGSLKDDVEEEIKPEFLPGITHFTDTLAALPKEMVRHSTMLKETDAKLYAPEQDLRAFLQTDAPEYVAPEPGQECAAQTYYENACNMMASMLSSLDEKNHVLTTANDALEKLILRCESAWPLIEQEISEDTRRGRLDHWAYTDRSADKKPSANTERASRRNNDAEKSAAALVADVLNSKGSKGHKRIGQDAADAEEASKKSSQNKRKPNDTITGLGISAAGIKRRKVEKSSLLGIHGGQPMEKSLSAVFRNIPNSPLVSAADGKKKAKNVNGTSANGRRRAGTATSNAGSPSMMSSPVLGAFAMSGKVNNMPALGAPMARTTSSRARGGPTSNPVQSTRPASAASTPLMNGVSYPDEKPTMSRTNSGFRGGDDNSNGNGDIESRTTYRSGIKREESSARPRPPSISTASRNNGKASKTGTPVLGSFPDTARPRSGRNSTTTLNAMDIQPPKRSHKKKEPAALQRQRSQQKAGGRAKEDDESDDADEPGDTEQLYCYCNGPSHGEMVACDMPGCAKEWFHLACVGLTKPPSTKSKWFCPDCRKDLQ